MSTRRLLVPSLALAAALAFAACGSDDPAPVELGSGAVPASSTDAPADDQLVHPDTPAEDIGEDPDSQPVATPAADPAGGIAPAEGEAPPAEQVVTGRVLRVDRDGPSVEIVEVTFLFGADATDAARANGDIGPDEEWELDSYLLEGQTRWVDIDPAAAVAVYDCTQACEHVAGDLEHVLIGSPYAGTNALWSFALDGGRATAVDEVYTA